jgi:two-component system NarL family sensor kinase
MKNFYAKLLLSFLLLLCSNIIAKTQTKSSVKENTIKEIKSLVDKADKLSEKDTVNTKLFLEKALALAIKAKVDSCIADIYGVYGIMYGVRDLQKQSYAYFEKALAYHKKGGPSLKQANTMNNMSIGLSRMGKSDESLRMSKEALKMYQLLGNKQKESLSLMNIGIAYFRLNNLEAAIRYQLGGLAIREKFGNARDLSFSYNNLGTTYKIMKNYDQAIIYFNKGIAVTKQLNDISREAPLIYNLGEIFVDQNKLPDAQKYIEQALEYYVKMGDERGQRKCYEVLASIAKKRGQNEVAEGHLKKAIQLSAKTNSAYNEVMSLINLAELNTLQNKPVEAEASLLKAEKYAKDNKLAEEVTIKAALLELYLKNPSLVKRNGLFKEYEVLRDSIWNKNTVKQINELQTKYETEKKQQQILLLGKENQIQGLELNRNKLELENRKLENDRNLLTIDAQELVLERNRIELANKQIEAKTKAQQVKLLATENELQRLELIKRNIFLAAIGAILLVTVVIGYLFYNRYKLRQEARLQAEVIVQQDHATKSILQAEENERKRISGELHDGLGQLFSAVKLNLSALSDDLNFNNQEGRATFEKTMSMVDESCKEIRVISHQMAPNVLLKSGLTAAVRDFISKIDSRRLKINLETFGLQTRLDPNIEAVLYRVIQETVNNVIKHSGANVLDIQLNRDDEGINAMIEDNGKGFDTAQIEKFEGIGLKNIRTRVNFLKGTVDFSSSLGNGTLIAIFIPT